MEIVRLDADSIRAIEAALAAGHRVEIALIRGKIVVWENRSKKRHEQTPSSDGKGTIK